jgi:hypothetical protein
MGLLVMLNGPFTGSVFVNVVPARVRFVIAPPWKLDPNSRTPPEKTTRDEARYAIND